MAIVVYGLRQCDKTRAFLKASTLQNIEIDFIDLDITPLDQNDIERFKKCIDLESLLNRRSTTYRQLSNSNPEILKEPLGSLLIAHNRLLKRPLVHNTQTNQITFGNESIEKLKQGAL